MSDSPFIALVKARRSVRRYDARPVSDEDIIAIAEAARLAPSADNVQPWRFIVVRDPAVREKLIQEAFSGINAHSRRLASAPVFIVICAEKTIMHAAARMAQGMSYPQIDCGIAGEHLVLAAAERGLGTCWIGLFNRRKTRKLLGIPPRVELISLIALGHPEDSLSARPKGRKPLASMLWLDGWAQPFPGAGAQDGMEK